MSFSNKVSATHEEDDIISTLKKYETIMFQKTLIKINDYTVIR